MANLEILFQNKLGETFRISAGRNTNIEKLIKEREAVGDSVIAIGSLSEVLRLTESSQRIPVSDSQALFKR